MRLIGLLGSALIAATTTQLACDPREQIADVPRPNVVLLVVDTLRADHIRGYGYSRETTPTLDAFIAGGARFDAAIAPGSWSPPSQITIVTGVNPYRHKVLDFGHSIDDGVDPLAVLLKRAGYSTALFSSHVSLHTGVGRATEGVDSKLLDNAKDARMLATALSWARKAEPPYFLYLCLTLPHASYDTHPSDYEKLFTDMPPGGDKTYPFTEEIWVGIGAIPRSVRLGDDDQLGHYVNAYDREIRYLDDLVGKFWRSMEEEGLNEDTVLVMTSDHGEALGDHDAFAHEYYLYDFLVRVPLIVYYPEQVPAGQVWSEQVSLTDVVPTILGFAKVEPPPYLEGVDLSGHLVANTRPEESRLATGSYRARGFDRYMVRSRRHKLIYDAQQDREEFYDLSSDPAETRNLVPARAEPFDEAEYDRMQARLARLRELHQDISPGEFSHPLTPEVQESLRALGYIE